MKLCNTDVFFYLTYRFVWGRGGVVVTGLGFFCFFKFSAGLAKVCIDAAVTYTHIRSGFIWNNFFSFQGKRSRRRTVKSLAIWTVVHRKFLLWDGERKSTFIHSKGEARTEKEQPQLQKILKKYWQYIHNTNMGTQRVKPKIWGSVMNLSSCSQHKVPVTRTVCSWLGASPP